MCKTFISNGFDVSVVCPLPNYPEGRIFKDYNNKFSFSQELENIKIFRYLIYPYNGKNIFKRIFSMLSFSISLWLFVFKYPIIQKSNYVIIQNSPLLVSFSAIIFFKYIFNKKIILNISDLWPLSAFELGYMKKSLLYNFLTKIEKFNYINSELILCQSNEIISHVKKISKNKTFLYRNLPVNTYSLTKKIIKNRFKNKRLVYAGLLGEAQGIYNLISSVNFKELGFQFDIYGFGPERDSIKEFINNNPECGVNYLGSVDKNSLNKILPEYYASIVILRTKIFGAVPSKIFELIRYKIPIIFSGHGEPFTLVKNWKIGFTSDFDNTNSFLKNLKELSNLSINEYIDLTKQLNKIDKKHLNFDSQFDKLIYKIKNT